MGITTAIDLITLLKDCDKLIEFLEQDIKSKNEVGFSLGEDGTIYQFREGNYDNITFTLPTNEQRMYIHTHPSVDTVLSEHVTVSERDMEFGENPLVSGLIVLSQEMFDSCWKGKAILFTEEERESVNFTIDCNGVIDGPTEERWLENPSFTIRD